MMIKGKSSSMKELRVQGKTLIPSTEDASGKSPPRKKSKKVPGRSKSLIETSSKKTHDAMSNQGIYLTGRHQSYMRRVPTQDDIYKILHETRPASSSGESKRLSPYVPLPAIGTRYKPIKNKNKTVSSKKDGGEDSPARGGNYIQKNNKSKISANVSDTSINRQSDNSNRDRKDNENKSSITKNISDSTNIKKGVEDNSKRTRKTNNISKPPQNYSVFQDDKRNISDKTHMGDSSRSEESTPKLVREGTYKVLKPKFVKGTRGSPKKNANKDNSHKRNTNKKQTSNPLQESSATIVFGPRLPTEDIVEEDLTDLDFPYGQHRSSFPQTASTASSGNETGVQKLYYRNSDDVPTNIGDQLLVNDISNVKLKDPTSNSGDIPSIQPTFWFSP